MAKLRNEVAFGRSATVLVARTMIAFRLAD